MAKVLNIAMKVERLKEVISKGGVIIFPTDTIYGVGGDAYNQSAVDRIYKIKRRDKEQPIALLLGEVREIKSFCQRVTPKQRKWLEKLLPGPFTVLLWAKSSAPQASVSKEGKIGLRVPDSEPFRKIYRVLEYPLIGTSVNISGHPPLIDIEDIVEQFSDKVDLIIQTDEAMTNRPSSVIDLTGSRPEALRGSLPERLQLK